MRRAIVIGGVPTCPGGQVPCSSVLMFNEHLPCHNEDQMAFVTPMVGNVGCAIFNQSELDVAKLACPHSSSTRFPWVFR